VDEGAGVTFDPTPIPATGITRDEHAELVAAKGRPLTQGPIRRRRQVDDAAADLGGMTVLDGVLAEHLRSAAARNMGSAGATDVGGHP
jgi:hypothetical protein